MLKETNRFLFEGEFFSELGNIGGTVYEKVLEYSIQRLRVLMYTRITTGLHSSTMFLVGNSEIPKDVELWIPTKTLNEINRKLIELTQPILDSMNATLKTKILKLNLDHRERFLFYCLLAGRGTLRNTLTVGQAFDWDAFSSEGSEYWRAIHRCLEGDGSEEENPAFNLYRTTEEDDYAEESVAIVCDEHLSDSQKVEAHVETIASLRSDLKESIKDKVQYRREVHRLQARIMQLSSLAEESEHLRKELASLKATIPKKARRALR